MCNGIESRMLVYIQPNPRDEFPYLCRRYNAKKHCQHTSRKETQWNEIHNTVLFYFQIYFLVHKTSIQQSHIYYFVFQVRARSHRDIRSYREPFFRIRFSGNSISICSICTRSHKHTVTPAIKQILQMCHPIRGWKPVLSFDKMTDPI